jgi:hypothetical protein
VAPVNNVSTDIKLIMIKGAELIGTENQGVYIIKYDILEVFVVWPEALGGANVEFGHLFCLGSNHLVLVVATTSCCNDD